MCTYIYIHSHIYIQNNYIYIYIYSSRSNIHTCIFKDVSATVRPGTIMECQNVHQSCPGALDWIDYRDPPASAQGRTHRTPFCFDRKLNQISAAILNRFLHGFGANLAAQIQSKSIKNNLKTQFSYLFTRFAIDFSSVFDWFGVPKCGKSVPK